jgi:hypothetical protein
VRIPIEGDGITLVERRELIASIHSGPRQPRSTIFAVFLT